MLSINAYELIPYSSDSPASSTGIGDAAIESPQRLDEFLTMVKEGVDNLDRYYVLVEEAANRVLFAVPKEAFDAAFKSQK